jgi:hypothetical protein
MVTVKGEIKFNRELRAGEITTLQTLFSSVAQDASKPNLGIYPFRFLSNFSGFEWDETSPVYEIENLLKIIIDTSLPKDVNLNGLLIYEEKDGDYYNGYKIYVDSNKIRIFDIDTELPEKAKLLRCPHCQKVFKKEDFKEVFQ